MHLRFLAVATIVMGVHVAHADCAWVGTPAGTTLPQTGSVYVHAATPPTVRISAGSFDVVRLGDELQRIDYRGNGDLDVTLGEHVASYPLARFVMSEPRALAYWHDTTAGRDALAIQLDQAPAAVLARWTFDDVTTEWLVAPQTSDALPGVSMVVLGETECGASTLSPAQLRTGGALELVAIAADGTRTRVGGLPAHLAHETMPASGHALGLLAVPSDEPPPTQALVPADWNPMRGLDDVMTYLLIGVTLFVGLALVALRSKRPLRT